jgi:hypothetical protein
MSTDQTIAIVRRHNAWRRGDSSEMLPPRLIGEALDALCDHVARLERELDQERQDRKQADLDAIRALGERNDARKELDRERALADRLAARLEQCREDSIELLGERHWWKDEPGSEYSKRYEETAENVVAAAEALDAYKAARES